MIIGEDKFKADEEIILDYIAEICAKYKGIKHVCIQKSVLNPFEINVRLEGDIDGFPMAQYFVLDVYHLMEKSAAYMMGNLSKVIDELITNAGLFKKEEPLE